MADEVNAPAAPPAARIIPSIRLASKRATTTANLGLIAELSGTWTGQGFNLIARPDFQNNSPLFLQLNHTFEKLSIVPISSSIPNRGSAVDDITLFGLTYLQEVFDINTQGALHIEPGIWIHIPSQDAAAGVPPLGPLQSVARMGTIPHGNAILLEGSAFTAPPFTPNAAVPVLPSTVAAVNTSPFAVTNAFQPNPAVPPVGMPIPGTLGGFPPYDISNLTPASVQFRTPFGDGNDQFPDEILGVSIQDLILDPVKLLDAALSDQTIKEMTTIIIATDPQIFQQQPGGAPVRNIVDTFNTGGGAENIPFLEKNADAATVFATFWIEKIAGATEDEDFLQLQYVQTVLLNFPILNPDGTFGALLSWPHVSVATLRKTFGGQ